MCNDIEEESSDKDRFQVDKGTIKKGNEGNRSWNKGFDVMTDPILIVEDDKKTAALLALYLEREGFQTLTAYVGLALALWSFFLDILLSFLYISPILKQGPVTITYRFISPNDHPDLKGGHEGSPNSGEEVKAGEEPSRVRRIREFLPKEPS